MFIWLAKRLRPFGKAGELAAAGVTLLDANWGIAMTAILAFITGWWTVAFDFVQQPRIYVGALVFLVLLWTLIGILMLRDRGRPIRTQGVQRLEHSLVWNGFLFVHDANDDDHFYQIGVAFTNHSGNALKYQIEQFDVIIEKRFVNVREEKNTSGIIPFASGRTYWCNAYKKEDVVSFVDKKVKGSIELAMMYGPHNGKFQRRLKIKVEGYFIIGVHGAMADRLVSESEEDII